MHNQNLRDKLLRIERTICCYLKNGDELLWEINADNIPFERLREIVPPNEDDPLLYDGYELDENQIASINAFLEKEIIPDFKVYNYF